jgi:hypothetical protein
MCNECYGAGVIITCPDDLCQDGCIHGDGEIICPECKGEGYYYDDTYYDGMDDDEEFGCCMEDCIMPGLHFPSECHNSAMLEAMYRDQRLEDLRQRFFVVNLTFNAVEWLRRRVRDVQYFFQRNKQDEIPF